MTEAMVSVHMITYNHAPYIAKAIECALAQKTNFTFELVIGEDCSTDGTREIVLDYARRYPHIIRVVTSDRNVGMHKNSYRTLKACRGKYIAWCEGDDYWQREDKLQLQVDYLENHPECGLVHSDQDRYFEESDIMIESFFQTTDSVPPDNFNMFRGWNGYHIITCAVMARNVLVKRIVENEVFYTGKDYIGGTDIPLFIELSVVSKVHYINESLATYTVRRESACHFTDIAKQTKFTRSVCGCYLYLAKKYDAKNEIAWLTNRYNSISLNCALWNNDIVMAMNVKEKNKLDLKQNIMYVIVINPFWGFVAKYILGLRYKFKNNSFLKMVMRSKS